MLYNLFILTIITLHIILSKYRLKLAILLIITCLPIYLLRFKFFIIPSTVLEIMIFISFSFWLFYKTNFTKAIKGEYKIKDYFKEKKHRLKYPFGTEIILLLIISFIAIIIGGSENNTFGIWKAYFFEPILLYLLLLNNFQKKQDIKKIFIAIGISCFLLSIYAIFQKFTGIGIVNEFWQNINTRRVTSVFLYPNALALYLAPAIFILIGWGFSIFNKNKKMAIFAFITTIISILSIYFAQSESALIAILISLLLFLILNKKTRTIGFISVIIISIGLFSSSTAQEYIKYKASLNDQSGQIRLQQWKETWGMLTNNKMITGSGLANYKKSILPYHQEGIFFNSEKDPDFRRKIVIFNDKYRAEHWQPVEIYLYPHNIFLNFWVELGLFGMILFIWIIGKFLYQSLSYAIKTKNYEDKFIFIGLFCSMLVILIHGLLDVPYFKNDLSIFFWILIGMLVLLIESTSQDNLD